MIDDFSFSSTIARLKAERDKRITTFFSRIGDTFRKVLEKQAYLDYRMERDEIRTRAARVRPSLARQIDRTANALVRKTVCGERRGRYYVEIRKACEGLIAKLED